MAINWQKLEIDIKSYLELGKNDRTGKTYSAKNTAKMIETLYVLEIQSGATDIFLNPVITLNIQNESGLKKSLEQGFNSSFNVKSTSILNSRGISGVLQNWSGVQFSPLIPVLPAMTVGVNNTVTSPGSIIPMNLFGTSKTNDLLSKEIVKALKAHAGTIQGLFTGLTAIGNPIAIPWVGII